MTAYALSNLQTHLRVQADMKVFEPYQYVAHVGDELNHHRLLVRLWRKAGGFMFAD